MRLKWFRLFISQAIANLPYISNNYPNHVIGKLGINDNKTTSFQILKNK